MGENHCKQACGESGKASTTRVWLLSYDEQNNVSIVKCMPESGRSHQIRVHLASLGFPIANDPIYCDVVDSSSVSLSESTDVCERIDVLLEKKRAWEDEQEKELLRLCAERVDSQLSTNTTLQHVLKPETLQALEGVAKVSREEFSETHTGNL